MDVRVTRIKCLPARRAVMVLLVPVLAVAGVALGALAALCTLAVSFGAAWRDDAEPYDAAEVGVFGGQLKIHIPITLVKHAAELALFSHAIVREHGPEAYAKRRFRVTDPVKFAQAVGKVLRTDNGDEGTPVHAMIDDAVETVVDFGDYERDGWEWPGAGFGIIDPEAYSAEVQALMAPVHKGGVNDPVSQVTKRPGPPPASNV